MPVMLYPICWRDRADCEPIHCIDAMPEDTSEKDMNDFNYKPKSFVCSGCVKSEDRVIKQDLYRLCFKNDVTDEISDNDMQDLTSVIAVASAAMNLDAIRKVNHGIVELPADQGKADE